MANPFYVEPAQFGQGLQSLAGSVQQFGQQRAEQQRIQEQQEYEQRARQAMTEAVQSRDPQRMLQVATEYPEVSETMQQLFGFTNDQTRRIATDVYRQALSDPQSAPQILEQGIAEVERFGGTPSTMRRDLEMLQRDPEAGMRNIELGFAGVAPNVYKMMGQGGSDLPAGVREFNAMVEAAGLEPQSEEYAQAALVNLGLEPRAGISAKERIAQDPELQRRVADLERQTQAAKEEGKLETQRQLMPEIRKEIKAAEQSAQSRGEALSEYERAQVAIPGLREVVNKLKTLSDVATYSMAGRAFDMMSKELGFGSTEGSTARAKMQSLVDNQILPLLRDTFGAQFTEREGDRLRQTMLDINAPPEEKKQILDSFIEQKMRDLEVKRRRAGVEGPEQPTEGGGEAEVINWSDL